MSRPHVVAALIGLLVATAAPSRAQIYQATVAGADVVLLPQPITVGNVVLVPLRESLMAIGATDIRFSADANQVTFQHGGRQGMIDLNQNTATLDGQTMPMMGPARVLGGVAWVPAEFISSIDPRFSLVRVRGFRALPETALAPIPQPYGPNTFTYGGRTFTYSSPTWYMGGVLMVPLDETLQALGVAPSTVNPDDLQASFIWNNQIVRLNVMSGYAHVGDTAFPMARPVVVRGDTIYVPATFFAQVAPGYRIASMRVATPGVAVRGVRQQPGELEAGK